MSLRILTVLFRSLCLFLGLLPQLSAARAQALPPIATLIRQVETNQQHLDKTRESYTFRERQVMHELDKHGAVKKTESREYNVFFVNGHEIRRLVGKNSKPLDAAAEAKEALHMESKVQLAQNTPPGVTLNSRHDVSIARLLSIQQFNNERRVAIDGRPMIAFDFRGDPKAKTHGIAENTTKHLAGTLWIDEQDRQVRRMQATLDSPMHLGFGLVSIAEGSTMTFNQRLVNNEVWLPVGTTIHVNARAALFFGYRIEIQIIDDQYRRFHTSAEQQAGASAR